MDGNAPINHPDHPGRYVKVRVLDANGLSVTEAATALGVARPSLSKFLNGRAHLSPEMAIRIEKAFGMQMDTLMRMQTDFDIAEARAREGDINIPRFRKVSIPRPAYSLRQGAPR